MDDVFVAELMTTAVETVRPDALVETAAQLMLDEEIGSVVVSADDGELQGILTTTDFVDIVAQSHPKAETSVSRYMTTDVRTASAQATIQDVADMMVEHGFHHAPVVDGEGAVIGMVTSADIAAYVSTARDPSPD